MTADFTIQFSIDRSTSTYNIVLTDTSTDVVNLKGNFRVTFPDGFVYHNTDFELSPDISSAGGSAQITARTQSSDGEVMRGSYEFVYTALDEDDDIVDGNTKSFEFLFDEPNLEIENTSDLAIPTVRFSCNTDITATEYSETITSFTMTSPFPSTSDASAQVGMQDLSVSRELNQIYLTNYYEGQYDPVVLYSASYQHNSHSYLSVVFTNQISETLLIYAVQTSAEVLQLIENFKKTESSDEFIYNRMMSLYSNIETNARENIIDEGNTLLSELLSLLNVDNVHSFQSGPISGFIVSSQDLTNYYTKAEVDALISAFSGVTTEEITVSVNGGGLGGYDFLETIANGTPFTTVFRELLRSAAPATYTQPSISISGNNLANGTKTGEVGLNETVIISPTWTQNDAGSSNQFVVDKDDVAIHTDTTVPIPDASYNDTINAEGTFVYHGEMSYNQGPVLNDSLGDPDPSGQIPAGTITSNDVTYNKAYPWYFGTGATAPSSGSDILAGTKVIEVIGSSIQADFVNVSPELLWFAVPSSFNNNKTYTSWEDNGDSNNAGSIGGASNLFGDSSVISVTTVGLDSNYTIDYDVYVTNYATLSATLNLS